MSCDVITDPSRPPSWVPEHSLSPPSPPPPHPHPPISVLFPAAHATIDTSDSDAMQCDSAVEHQRAGDGTTVTAEPDSLHGNTPRQEISAHEASSLGRPG